MELERYEYFAVTLAVVLTAITTHGWIHLPGEIAIHFDASGNPDGTTGKLPGLMLLPVLFIGFVGLFRNLPSLDPLGENIESFRPQYDLIAASILGFLTYIQALIVSWNLGYSFSINQALAPGIAALYYIMGSVLEEARQNWFIGIRTPWTLSSEEVWNKTHRKFATWFKASGLIALGAVIFPDRLVELAVLPAVIVSGAAFVYSYLRYQK
jgi:uncharacterized membrane protein